MGDMDLQITLDSVDRHTAGKLAARDGYNYGPYFSDSVTVAAYLASLEKHERDNVLKLADRIAAARHEV